MKQLLVNIGHSALAKVLLMGVQMATTVILARNLSAQDYGVVGFANIIMALLLRVNSLGLTNAVIQRKDLNDTVIRTAVSLNVILSISAFLCAQAAAPLAAVLLNSPASVNVVRVLSIGFLLTPIGFLSTCLLNREMRFGTLRTPSVAGALVRGVVSVGMAVTGSNYWSLVLGNLAGTITTNGMLQLAYPSKLRWGLDWPEAKRLLSQGIPLTLSGLVTFALLNADNFYIGSIAGATMLGYYTVAWTWATFCCGALGEVVHRVLFPKFSRMQDNLDNMGAAFLRTLRVVSFGAAFFNFALLVTADGFLFQILGKGTYRWLPSCAALQILCVYGAIRAAVESVANPILALGDTKLLLYSNAVATAVEITLLPVTLKHFGIEGVGILVTLAYASQLFFFSPYLKKRLNVYPAKLLEIFVPVLLGTLTGVALAYAVPLPDSTLWPVMLVRLALFSVGFVTVHEVLSRGAILAELRLIQRSLWPKKSH